MSDRAQSATAKSIFYVRSVPLSGPARELLRLAPWLAQDFASWRVPARRLNFGTVELDFVVRLPSDELLGFSAVPLSGTAFS